VKVALLGCGVVGSQVVRLLHEQADDLAARVGEPLELAGVAVRRPQRHADIPAELLTTDAAALVARDDVDVVVEVIGGIEPVRIMVAGYGEFRPVVPNGSNGAAANRRVEVFLLPMPTLSAMPPAPSTSPKSLPSRVARSPRPPSTLIPPLSASFSLISPIHLLARRKNRD